MPSSEVRSQELIVGGELDIKEKAYIERLARSIKACISMLKRGRWFSVVFQHWNVAYFDAILSSAAEKGADLQAAITQVGDTIWSMHKKKGNESLLAGELILTFFKTGRPIRIASKHCGFDIEAAISDVLSEVKTPVMYGEVLFNQLILSAWKKQAIKSLHITKHDFNDLIRKHGWQYDEANHYWVKEQFQNVLFRSNA